MNKIVEDLSWRYATKKFDSKRKISEKEIECILESLRLVPTSFGLQPYKVLVISNEELREKLVPASFNQAQVKDASHLLVLCSYLELDESHIHEHVSNTATVRNLDPNTLEGFSASMKSYILNSSTEVISEWNVRQTYILLGQLLTTCAQMRIDSTPMEGFKKDEYDKILGLTERNLQANLVCPIGYRAEDDKNQNVKKVRKSLSDIIERID